MTPSNYFAVQIKNALEEKKIFPDVKELDATVIFIKNGGTIKEWVKQFKKKCK